MNKAVKIVSVFLILVSGVAILYLDKQKRDEVGNEVAGIFSDIIPGVIDSNINFQKDVRSLSFRVDGKHKKTSYIEISDKIKSKACQLMTHPETKGIDVLHIRIVSSINSDLILSRSYYKSKCR